MNGKINKCGPYSSIRSTSPKLRRTLPAVAKAKAGTAGRAHWNITNMKGC